MSIESLGLDATHWEFLSKPKEYVVASAKTDRKLAVESTKRQFRTAEIILKRLNGNIEKNACRGLLLADDVGLGKTTVAALVAWVVASSGKNLKVRILAPNDIMVRRWQEELALHVTPLKKCAPTLKVEKKNIRTQNIKKQKLMAGTIQVVKHSYASSGSSLSCDLLIVDEAHRAKGENSEFCKELKRQKKFASRVLILTATPFSIRINELNNMLTLIGAESAHKAVNSFSGALNDLYSENTFKCHKEAAVKLADKAKAAINAFRPFVIRHSIDDLPMELKSFGGYDEWQIDVPPATSEELELILRMDRALFLSKACGWVGGIVSNDPRFHVGWHHFDSVKEKLQIDSKRFIEPYKTLIQDQLDKIMTLRQKVGIHSKIAAVAKHVADIVETGEKVILFCHHHATAQELTSHLAFVLPVEPAPKSPDKSELKGAWDKVLESTNSNTDVKQQSFVKLRATFINWLCTDLINSQTMSWLNANPMPKKSLVQRLRLTTVRHHEKSETIADAAEHLFKSLLSSKSSRAVLTAAETRIELLPGANGVTRVLGVCEHSNKIAEKELFLHNVQLDTVINIFNSPFGPDVLVVTDKLSEGIDLHRYCRHLIHYELDPSPIRTVQRNGRLRRVNSWAAVTGQPIRYAYPAFAGTRDHRLVQIMKKRINSFSLLLGGVQDINVDTVLDADEKWRNDVLGHVKTLLVDNSGVLSSKIK